MILANAVMENSTSTGLAMTLTGAVAGCCRFSDVVTVPGVAAEGDTFRQLTLHYRIDWDGGYEIGLGGIDPIDSHKLHRILAVATSAEPVNASALMDLPAGPKTVSLVIPASQLPAVRDYTLAYIDGALAVVDQRSALIAGPVQQFVFNNYVAIDGSGAGSVVIGAVPTASLTTLKIGFYRDWNTTHCGGGILYGCSNNYNDVPLIGPVYVSGLPGMTASALVTFAPGAQGDLTLTVAGGPPDSGLYFTALYETVEA